MTNHRVGHRLHARVWTALFALLLCSAVCAAQSPSPVIEVPNPPNAPAQQAKPYVILVSLDGFRYDYAAKYGAINIAALAEKGASAPDGMIPSFPSVTFPNHYSIATGLYPEHHGIVANSFYDPARNETYRYTDSKAVGDGTWYGGTPLWVLAESQGMRAASSFWPGSEAEIQGQRPSYYAIYDNNYPDEARVDTVLAWLHLPADKRPHFITLYMGDVDHAGHDYGPDSQETREAVTKVDAMIARLEQGIAASGLPVDLIVLADHGMEKVEGGWILLDKWADLSDFVTVGSLLYPKSDAAAAKAYEALRNASPQFKVYRRADVPASLHYDSNAREGDPVVIPTGPYALVARDPGSGAGATRPPPVGAHGYDPATMPTMKAIFFAQGPDFRAGARVAPFENVDIYPLVARILGLKIGRVDGTMEPLKAILKASSKN